MADETKLQIILQAVNETANPFKELEAAVESFQKSTSELAKSIEESFKTMNSAASSSATSMEESVKGDNAAFQDLARVASEQTKLASESMSGMNKSALEMAKAMNESAADIERDMKAATSSIGDFEKSAASGLTGAGKEMNTLRDNMNKGVGEIGGLIAIQMLGQSMEELGKKGEHLFDYAIEQGSDFQQTMQNVKTVIAANADGTGSWTDKLSGAADMTQKLQEEALTLGSRGAQSANEIAKAQDTMLRAGVDATAVLGGAAEAAQNVAIVTGDKLDESANLVTEIFHQFRESFAENGKSVQENMKTTGDVLTGTLLSARINSQDFLDTLKYVGPVASQLGSTFLDTATATAVLAQNGIKGSQAGNNLKRAMTSLLEPTKQGASAMEHLGLIQNGHNKLIDESTGKMRNLTEIQKILHSSLEGLTEVQKAKYIHDMFGQYALAGTLVLANENSEAFQKMKDHIGNVSAENAASAMLDTFSGHMAQLKAHVETTAKEFGLSFLPALEKLLPIGQKILNWLQELTPANKEFLMGLLAVGSAVAIAGGALATMAISMKFAGEGFEAIKGIFMIQKEGEAAITVFKAFSLAIKEVGFAEAFMDLMSPVGWIVLAVAAIVGLAVVIIQYWGPIKDFLSKLWTETAKIATEVWGAVSKFFIDLWKSISDTTTNTWNQIKQFFTEILVSMGATIAGAVNTIKLTWNEFINGIQSMWSGFTSWMSSTTNQLVKDVVGIWNGLISGIVNLWNGFTAMISSAVQATMQGIVDAFSWMYNHNYYFKDLVDFITSSWDTITKTTKQIWDDLTKLLKDTWNTISSTAVTVWTAISDYFSRTWNIIKKSSEDLWNAIVQFITDTWNTISSTSKTIWNTIADFFTSLWNGISTFAKFSWNALRDFLRTVWNEMVNIGKALWQPIDNFFSMLWGGISTTTSNVWNSIKTFLSGLWNGLVSDAEGIFNGLETFFTGLWNKAYNWGSNLVHMIAEGIKSAASEVAQAAQSVASSISSFLGFHSPAEKGPGADADVWMPNLFKMMTDQVYQKLPDMHAALNLAFNPSMMGITNMGAVTNMSPVMSGGGSSPVYNIIVNANGNITESNQKLGDIVSTAILDKMKNQGKLG